MSRQLNYAIDWICAHTENSLEFARALDYIDLEPDDIWEQLTYDCTEDEALEIFELDSAPKVKVKPL